MLVENWGAQNLDGGVGDEDVSNLAGKLVFVGVGVLGGTGKDHRIIGPEAIGMSISG